ncbi:Zinc finger C2H2 isoform 1 [Schistosoma japonicum]|uniref:Zinc finger C2H2 isoform 1 n=1 Tax=Schistosoma japonicum TaxID=6182 RepID=A0A4Z2CT52_SCHJA|nr:Zinc finger C2H2 isoform 1 [Schistosoma japonicum]TNN07415.1 Zinc finger C2H2 isoform 1 [Schistosoma japonicum]
MSVPGQGRKINCPSLKRNIQLLEDASGCFTCSLCAQTTGLRDDCFDNLSHRLHKFDSSTCDPDAFDAHLMKYHANNMCHLCLYCNSIVHQKCLTIHISQHLLTCSSSKSPKVFVCPSRPQCPHEYSTDHFQHMQIHWESQHSSSFETSTNLQCSQCMNIFSTLLEWGEHIKLNLSSLVHCTFPGCFIKSPSRALILDHFRRKHANCLEIKGKTLFPLYRETSELICDHLFTTVAKLDNPSRYDNNSLITVADQPPAVNKVFADISPPFVFLLRCPYCDLATVRWIYFLMHPASCTGIKAYFRNRRQDSDKALPLVYRCHIFWCSKCQVVSTEQKLIAEHVTYCHNPKEASVYREHLRVSLLDDNSEPATADLPLNTEQKSDSSTYTMDLFPSSFSIPEDGTEKTESPMNLAALARPTASKLISLTSRVQQTLPSNIHTLSVNQSPSSIYNGVIVSNSITNIPANSSLNIINGASAVKTLQSLTVGQDAGSFSACDAASAVAAMAAAALSSFTNFNINNAVTSSVSAFSKSLPCDVSSPIPIQPKPSTLSIESIDSVQENKDGNMNDALDSQCSDSLDSLDKSVDEYLSSDDSCRGCEGLVSFPFDECKFRSELCTQLQPQVIDLLALKMKQFSSYFVRILGKENHRRIPVCPECDKVFPYGLGDFKRHLLTVHLEIPREHLKDCLRFTYLPKSEEKFQEVQEQLAMRQMKPRVLEVGRRRIPLPYSIRILRRLTVHLPVATREFLEQKMQLYSRLSVIVDTRGGFRRYKCNHCSYSSPHALADVRKHILGSHCGISTKHFRHCLQSSRLDPVEFTLFSDEKLARLARDFLHRRQVSNNSGSPIASPNPTNDNSFSESASMTSSTTPNSLSNKTQDSFASHFTAVVPGSKTKVTVRIRPPVPPDLHTLDSTSPTQSVDNHISTSPNISNIEQSTLSSNPSVDLASLPSIPGIEGADRVVDLALPFSEPVLRQLLESSGAPEQHIEDIVSKMRVYSTYKMSRICRNDRTIAFRCPCGRLFITTRQPDSKIRAATLADSRRHVMGVHARIPNVFITICCQASRITREYDFQIYPDDMLLRLAMDRPIKLNNLPPDVSTVNVNSRSLSSNFAKPLKELAPYPSVPTIAPLQPMNTHSLSSSPRTQATDATEIDSVSEGTDTGAASGSICLDDSFNKNENDDEKEGSDIDPKKIQKESEDPLAQLNAVQASGAEEVERIIDLPYSSEALKTLVQGYCPPNYFPVLEAKMGVYSSLKVYITRRRGRRYFCCSGCSSSSPHGMGDIRKHILGVHAKVPERYKAAAMHCSRLSREDNTLLPNHVLLHLAKMKWKGTVIKPLSEMDLTQFGSRRASAVGLPRPSGQFASQVYQPTVHREVSFNRSDHMSSSPSKNSVNKSLSMISVPDVGIADENDVLNSGRAMNLPEEDGINDQDNEEEIDGNFTTGDNHDVELPELSTNIFHNSMDYQSNDDSFDLPRPAKISRLHDDGTIIVYPLPVNGVSSTVHENISELSNPFSSIQISNTPVFETQINKPTITLSGSSRRKPNKMQLVQLRPDYHYSESNFQSIHSVSSLDKSTVSLSSQQSNDILHSQLASVNNGNSNKSESIVGTDCDHLTKINHPPVNSIQNRIGV